MYAVPRLKSRHLASAVAGRRALLPLCARCICDRPSFGIPGFYYSSGSHIQRYGSLGSGLIRPVLNFGVRKGEVQPTHSSAGRRLFRLVSVLLRFLLQPSILGSPI